MANDGHQITVAARLRPEHAKTILAVVEGHALDETGEHFLGRWLKIGLHTDCRIIRFVSWRYVHRRAKGVPQGRDNGRMALDAERELTQ